MLQIPFFFLSSGIEKVASHNFSSSVNVKGDRFSLLFRRIGVQVGSGLGLTMGDPSFTSRSSEELQVDKLIEQLLSFDNHDNV